MRPDLFPGFLVHANVGALFKCHSRECRDVSYTIALWLHDITAQRSAFSVATLFEFFRISSFVASTCLFPIAHPHDSYVGEPIPKPQSKRFFLPFPLKTTFPFPSM
jgi:hypothetical protein